MVTVALAPLASCRAGRTAAALAMHLGFFRYVPCLTTPVIDHYFHLEFERTRGLQEQLREALVDAILHGAFPPDEPLPSCRDLSRQLSVARNTVALVYESLLEKGFLQSRPRSGYYLHPDYRELASRLPSLLMRDTDRDAGTGGAPDVAAGTARSPSWGERIRQPAGPRQGILRPSNWRQYQYPFAYGQADPALFPAAAWRRAARETLQSKRHRDFWISDAVDQDDPELITQLRTRVLPKRGIQAAPGEILVTQGSQNALYLLARLLTGPGVRVGLENPGFRDAWNVFAMQNADISLHDVDAHGLCLDDRLAECDYVYVTPSHQVPTGVTLSAERRTRLWQQAHARDQVLIEDDYDADLDLSSHPPPALKAADRHGRVIYLSSFSKSLGPGLRLGYLVADEELVRELRALRRLMLRHAPLHAQRLLARFLAEGDYDAHLRRYRSAHARKHDALRHAIEQHLDGCAYAGGSGASAFWLQAPEAISAQKLAWAASRRSVLIEPGAPNFFDVNPPDRHFRLGFSAISAERIAPGIELLADVMARV
ncbi:GntR family transcriptional regulator [Hylemonella gracilis ATCC 19624]|uniref:GntR family transcriptional regulator n=1 Tax=Hylemonella gracilis ATCC 19624 TaxID=887062 RepID=F3KUT6_9BURK|nr:GntR family transcriptional regulator [Hylemonella gracilis ATCC 19624]